MTRLLFVDDEPHVLSGLRRQLHSRRGEWDMRFVGGGEAALAALRQQPADVVVTDMRMPGMDGAELLRHVREQWPAAIRLVLSGHSDRRDLLRSIHEAHQFLAKPCDVGVLCTAVERAARLRAQLHHAELVALVARLDHLPSLPALHQEITSSLRGDHLSAAEIATLIQQDVALAAKVMQLVSSAFFGAVRHVSSPAEAAVSLGPETLRSLLLDTDLFEPVPADAAGTAEIEGVWLRSQRVAQLARGFATQFGFTPVRQDHAFLAGLMHEVGRLVLLSGGPAARALPAAAHPATGAFLLAIWGFPDEVVEAVALQGRQDPGVERTPSVPAAVRLAIRAARGESTDVPALPPAHPGADESHHDPQRIPRQS